MQTRFRCNAGSAVPLWRQVWNLLGLCRTCMGDIQGGVAAYKRAIALAPDFREAWLNLAQARKEARPLLTPAHTALDFVSVHSDMAWLCFILDIREAAAEKCEACML